MSKHKLSSNKYETQISPGPPVTSKSQTKILAGAVIIALAAFIAYLPSIHGRFVWDDNDIYVTNNQIIKSSDGLYKFWFTTEPPEYHPITNTTFWIEWRLWGLKPTGYHVTNLILHIVESLLIWVVLRKLSIPGAFLAALIFAVHPVNVESAAWIAQRKNLMAMLFFLLSILCYLKMEIPGKAGQPQNKLHPAVSNRWYWLSFLTFVLAMLSKGSVAMMPVLLLGILWWLRPLTRWDLVRTAPFFVIATVLTVVHVWFQTHGDSGVIREAGFIERLLGAGGVIWFYLYKALLPLNLAFVYPQWRIETNNLLWWLPLTATLMVTAVLWRYKESWSRPYLFAWGFFCVTLLPVMGFTDVYFMQYSLVADHYQHIAIIGVVALTAAGFNVWHQRMRGRAYWAATVLGIAAAGTLAYLSWRQSGLYSDEITLYQDTLKKNPDCWMAHNNLGLIKFQAGRHQEAIEHLQEALRIKSNYPEAHNNLGNKLFQIGRVQEALEHYEKALQLKSDYPEAQNNLSNALVQIGRFQEAIEHCRQALQIKPDFPEAYYNLGNALFQTGQIQEAVKSYERAIQLKSDFHEAHNNLGFALFQTGQTRAAITHYEQALRIKPDYINAYYNLASAYARLNQPAEAIAAAQKGLEFARSQGQTSQAKQIEDWLNSYRASISDLQSNPLPSNSVLLP